MMRRLLFVAPLAAFFALACKTSGTQERARSETSDAGVQARAGEAGPAVVRVDGSLVTSGRISTAPASRRPMKGDLRLPAEIVPTESAAADVGTLVSGRLGSIDIREGEAVKRGQVIAYVDSPEAGRAAADVIRARARTIAASRKLD
ncbi:MAG: putative Co/Zn/Cd efflux system rane fusion protein, partial [Myxococcaceae bacterium]|nr:putative Co/Zn/Cd efflux system rane fusion protein [Myxococcaceae bacterium]